MFFLPEARGACLADEAGEVSTKVSLLHPRESEISDLLSRKKAPFSETERKEAIFSMPGDKAPGPDLMPTLFYKVFWEVITGDVILAFHSFRKGG